MTQPLDYVPTHSALFYPKPRAFNPLSLAFWIAIGIAIALAAGWFYNWFYYENNNLVARLLACAGMTIGLGFLCTLVSEMGEVSDWRIAMIVSLAITSCCLYVTWMLWTQRAMVIIVSQKVALWHLILRPIPVARLLVHLNDFGLWTYAGIHFRGWPLLVIWILEGLLFTVPGPIAAAVMVMNRAPLCLACRKRVQRDGEVLKFSARDERDFEVAVLDRQFERLHEFEQTEEERADSDSPRIIIKLFRCPTGHDTHLLHAAVVSYRRTRKGARKRVERPMLEYMIVGAEQADFLKSLVEKSEAEGCVQ
jgi:hypothetical protein